MAEKRVAELAQDERHHTVAETRYWCQQYRTMAEQLERERDEARALLREVEWVETRTEGGSLGVGTQCWFCDGRDGTHAPDCRLKAALEGRDA